MIWNENTTITEGVLLDRPAYVAAGVRLHFAPGAWLRYVGPALPDDQYAMTLEQGVICTGLVWYHGLENRSISVGSRSVAMDWKCICRHDATYGVDFLGDEIESHRVQVVGARHAISVRGNRTELHDCQALDYGHHGVNVQRASSVLLSKISASSSRSTGFCIEITHTAGKSQVLDCVSLFGGKNRDAGPVKVTKGNHVEIQNCALHDGPVVLDSSANKVQMIGCKISGGEIWAYAKEVELNHCQLMRMSPGDDVGARNVFLSNTCRKLTASWCQFERANFSLETVNKLTRQYVFANCNFDFEIARFMDKYDSVQPLFMETEA